MMAPLPCLCGGLLLLNASYHDRKVTLFVAFLGVEGMPPYTIQSYLAALRHFYLLSNPSCSSPSFHTPYISVLLQGIKRAHSSQGKSFVRLPITMSLMFKIKHVLASQHDAYLNRLIWAACCTGFFIFALWGVSDPRSGTIR